MTYGGFAKLRDSLLSRPLDRSRPMWQMVLVPRLEDGGVGLLGKIHHSLVDGMAALQIVGLVVDQPSAPVLTHRTGATVAVPAMLRPITVARGLVSDAWRTLMAARQDVLPPAPKSELNAPIGPRRTLAGYHATRADLTAARAAGGTLNDTGLTIVAGAIRALATRRGETPAKPLKAMVPVNMRAPGELGPGNRIAMVYIQLPVHLRSPHERLQWVRDQTAELKDNRRATNMQTLYAAGGLLPAPLRSPVARALSSPLVFNLTISQSPGPRGQLHMLGCELQEVYSVVPIPAGHVLAIGMIRYRKELFIGCYADPDALPEVHLLPSLLDAELQALAAIRHRVVSR
jgi:WS/DGAT/MGAT family acyltransferase